jgi:hypothetical protein
LFLFVGDSARIRTDANVKEGQPPIHARRQIDIEHLQKIEESGRTVVIEPGLSFLANVIFLIVTMK